MCFSAPVSFAASSVLLVTGGYSVNQAVKKDRSWLLFALIPLVFSLQQFLEGLVWLGLEGGDNGLTRSFALAYMFFAFAFWPAYLSLSIYFIEQKAKMKKVMAALFLLGTVYGLINYLPFVLGQLSFVVSVAKHSICYLTSRPAWLKVVFVAGYALLIMSALCLTSEKRIKIFCSMFMALSILALIVNRAAFYSVWCFYSALLSLYIGYVLHKMPAARS